MDDGVLLLALQRTSVGGESVVSKDLRVFR